MYHCKICGSLAPRGQPRLVHVIERSVPATTLDRFGRALPGTRLEIAAEVPVCARCKRDLADGFSLPALAEMHRPIREPAAVVIEPVEISDPVEPEPPQTSVSASMFGAPATRK